MKILNNLYLKIAFAFLILLCSFTGHRTRTGGEEHGIQGGYFFLKSELSLQFRYHIDSVYRQYNIEADTYYAAAKNPSHNLLVQAISYRAHYLNVIPYLWFCLLFSCGMIGLYQVVNANHFYIWLSFLYGSIPIGINYFLYQNPYHNLDKLFSTCEMIIWVLCVIICLIFRNKINFNKWLLRFQIALISLFFITTCYFFIDKNLEDAANHKLEIEKAEQKTIEERKYDYPVEVPKK